MSAAPESPPEPQTLRLDSADLRDLARVRGFVRDSARALAADDDAVPDLVLAVDECAANIIRHGYRGPGPIEVEVGRVGADLVVHLRDEAPTFDPTAWPLPDLSRALEDRPAGGLGIYLARKSVDRLRHRARNGSGNELTFTMRMSGNGRPSDERHDRPSPGPRAGDDPATRGRARRVRTSRP